MTAGPYSVKPPGHVVSLTFDDALDCHLDTVIPLLATHGVHGTFYIPLESPSFAARIHEWRRAADAGHELGNHTIHHPAWSSKPYVSEGNAIERYTLDRMRRELEVANRILAGIDGRDERTFAYPCCNPILGRPGLGKRLLKGMGLERTRFTGFLNRHPWADAGSTETSYEPVVRELFLAARAGGERFSAGADFPPRRFAVPCVSLDGKGPGRLEELLADFLRRECGWLVFMAHGVGGGHRLCCEPGVLDGLLRTLMASRVSVLTFREAAHAIYGEGYAGGG